MISYSVPTHTCALHMGTDMHHHHMSVLLLMMWLSHLICIVPTLNGVVLICIYIMVATPSVDGHVICV